MRKPGWAVSVIGLISILLGACQSVPTTQLTSVPVAANAMPQGVLSNDPPAGFVSFCLRFQDQCTSRDNEPSTLQLSPAVWSQLVVVNTQVNREIWPVEDTKHFGQAEFWTIATDGYGDCEDYAVTKRQRLAGTGLPLKALRLAIVMTGRNNRHAVLTVATNAGDFVLDNETNDIVPWDQSGYRWIARQDAKNDWGWVSLETPAAGTTFAAAATTPPAAQGTR